MALDPQTLARLQPAEFGSLVKGMSDDEIRADLGGEHRGAILDAIFARFPQQFRPDKAGGRSARIDFHVTGGPGDSTDTYAVVVDDGTCSIEKEPTASPNLSLTMGPAEFLKMLSGAGSPAMMFMMGKIKATGDLGMAAGLANWFESPSG